MATKGRSLANAQGFIVKSETKTATEKEAELKEHVDFKMSIVDDFFQDKKKLTKSEKAALKKALENIKSTWGIDRYFQEFIYSKM